ncbi:MAG: hypothetical protein K6G82_05300 [Ruminococcus sp.]|nr:hypothetical protein [Ruminococcus sp.]
MKKEIIAIAAIALISTMTAVSCGSDVEQDSVSVALPKVTVASGEQTTTGTASTTKTTVTAAVVSGTGTSTGSSTTKSDDDEKDTETTAATEEKTDEDETPVVEPTEKATEAPTEAPKATGTGVSPSYIDQTFDSFASAYGTGYVESVVPSCIPKGDESDMYVYDYSGMTIQCYSSGGVKYVGAIHITGSNYATPEGVGIGSSKSDVEAAYGSGLVQGSGNILYRGAYNLEFIMNSDTVSEIDYDLAF